MSVHDPRFAILEQRISVLRSDMEAAIQQMGELLGQVVQMNQKYHQSLEKQLELLRKENEENGSDISESSEK